MGPVFPDFSALKKAYKNKECGATEGEFFTNAGANTRIDISTTSSHNRHMTVDVTALAWRWGTSIETASNTLTSMTTCAVRFYPADEFSHCFCTRQGQLHFPHLRTRWYLDTLVSATVSKCGYQYIQLFCNDEDWAVIVPM